MVRLECDGLRVSCQCRVIIISGTLRTSGAPCRSRWTSPRAPPGSRYWPGPRRRRRSASGDPRCRTLGPASCLSPPGNHSFDYHLWNTYSLEFILFMFMSPPPPSIMQKQALTTDLHWQMWSSLLQMLFSWLARHSSSLWQWWFSLTPWRGKY